MSRFDHLRRPWGFDAHNSMDRADAGSPPRLNVSRFDGQALAETVRSITSGLHFADAHIVGPWRSDSVTGVSRATVRHNGVDVQVRVEPLGTPDVQPPNNLSEASLAELRAMFERMQARIIHLEAAQENTPS